jgi:anaerobic nitric oxide reductase transcription regulator
MILPALLADLRLELPAAVRLNRLVATVRAEFGAGAVALLVLEGEALRPLAVDGLAREALGRRFQLAQHPRLAGILAGEASTRYPSDSSLPDPYDGLLDAAPGAPLPVHDCMGITLALDGQPWGVITLDALDAGRFDGAAARLTALRPLLETVVRVTRLEEERKQLRQARLAPADAADPARGAELIGHSAAFVRLIEELDVVADTGLPVLLLGETGVGKELLARRLHERSPRAARPLVHVNCAALPESLAESELFGHVRGAFSGAGSERAGRFEAAEGGTLFLDEVGELPLAIQAKLLRALQNGEIQRLGEDHPRRVDVRVIAATNRHLVDAVRAGDFRADLYHRLSVYPVQVPPLRERGNDALLLAGHFLELNRARLGLRSLVLAPAAEAALLAYPWPGNVRELEHVVSRAALRALRSGEPRQRIVTVEAEWLGLEPPSPSATTTAPPAGGTVPAGEAAADAPSLRACTETAQRAAIRAALERHAGNWSAAARALELDASNLHKLARRLGLKA